MTEPLPPVPVGWPENSLTWCSSCQVHYATAAKPLCVVCISIAAEEAKA